MLWIVLILLIVLFIVFFNQLVREKNQINNAFSSVDVILKKRYDLIPNLIETVKGYAAHEKELIENVTNLRTKAMNSKDNDEVVMLDRGISDGLSNIMLLAENYPDLKSSANFLNLQQSLQKIEDELSAARRTYNAAVNEYNISLESFPTNIVAKMMNLKKKELFTVEEAIRGNVKVNF